MKKTIEKLREKPKRDKQKVAFVGAFIVTAVIAFVWVSTFVTGFDSSSQTTEVKDPIDSLISLTKGVFGR